MYGKVFASCFTGSMAGSGSDVFAVWSYILANADKEGCLELNPKIIGAAIGMDENNVRAVIEKLQQPDPNSRSKKEDGRRIVRTGEFLYEIVNHKEYREMQNVQHRNDYMRKYMSDMRVLQKAQNLLKNEHSTKLLKSVSNVSGQVDIEVEVDTDTDVEAEAENTDKSKQLESVNVEQKNKTPIVRDFGKRLREGRA
jgi:hypothetical protein